MLSNKPWIAGLQGFLLVMGFLCVLGGVGIVGILAMYSDYGEDRGQVVSVLLGRAGALESYWNSEGFCPKDEKTAMDLFFLTVFLGILGGIAIGIGSPLMETSALCTVQGVMANSGAKERMQISGSH